MRKIILFLLIAFFSVFSLRNNAYAAEWSFNFQPNGAKAGNVTSLTITGDLPAIMYIILEGTTSTENCSPQDRSTDTDYQRQGCTTKTVTPSGDSHTFSGSSLGGNSELGRLKAGTYRLKICSFDDGLSSSCIGSSLVHEFSNVVVTNEGGGPPPSPDPGPGEGADCTIPINTYDNDVCIGATRLRGSCASNFYCKLNPVACTLGEGNCERCPDDEECYNGKSTALQQNSPLSLPCAKNGTSYSDAKGCLKIKTALGNVRTDSAGFTRWMLGFVLSISGGIVIIIILVAGYKLMTSQGDPEKVKNARDQLTAAIVGLLFIIFSLALLELITRDILGLPGFGR